MKMHTEVTLLYNLPHVSRAQVLFRRKLVVLSRLLLWIFPFVDVCIKLYRDISKDFFEEMFWNKLKLKLNKSSECASVYDNCYIFRSIICGIMCAPMFFFKKLERCVAKCKDPSLVRIPKSARIGIFAGLI